MSVLDRIKSISTIDQASVLSKSEFFNDKDVIPTSVPMLNVALSGKLDGGLTPGVTMLAGPSKHFKSYFGLLLARAYFRKYDDAVLLFYDTEFGSPKSYFASMGIDTERVFHAPVLNLEKLKFELVKQLDELKRSEHVMILIDSIGNVASKKEIEDALKEKGAADMTRAKELKSFFRMVTPYLTMKDVPMIVVNHTYETMDLFSKQVPSGGKGGIYNSDNIFIIGREQDKTADGKLDGYIFSLNAEKSRFIKEKSKIKIEVSFKDGINKWSGLLEIAVELGHVEKGKAGKATGYKRTLDDTFITEAKTNTKEFWQPLLDDEGFRYDVSQHFKLSEVDMMHE